MNSAASATPDLAIVARTAVAGTHAGLLTTADGGKHCVGYLDDDGEPVIVLGAHASIRLGDACLTLAGSPYRVVLVGRLTIEPGWGPAADLLVAHEPCFDAVLREGPVRLVRLALGAVRLEGDGEHLDVSCLDFAVAEPDLWAAHAADAAVHLSEVHADILTRMAALHLPHDELVAVAVRRLRRDRIDLDVVTPQGASVLSIVLATGVRDPHELYGRVLEQSAQGQVVVEHGQA